jgi:hypothetical protein
MLCPLSPQRVAADTAGSYCLADNYTFAGNYVYDVSDGTPHVGTDYDASQTFLTQREQLLPEYRRPCIRH